MQTFLNDVVKPALKKVAAELRNTGVESEIVSKKDSIELNVSYGGEKDFVYGVHSVRHVMPSFALDALDDDDETKRYYRGEVYLAEGSQHYDMYGYNQEQVIDDILIQYEKHMHFLHIVGDS
jgi:choline/glycine/proline betaine transport protein